MRFAIALLVAAVFGISPAQAETKWSGFHVGVHGGPDLSSIDAGAGPLGIDSLSANGKAFGLNGGYSWQVPETAIVIGIGADYTWSDATFSVSPGILSAEIDESWSVHARLGYSLGNVLPYVLAGYTEADASAKALGENVGGETLKGWMAGAGVEFALLDNVSLGAEYRYSDFETLDLGPGIALDADRHEFRASLRVRFDPFH